MSRFFSLKFRTWAICPSTFLNFLWKLKIFCVLAIGKVLIFLKNEDLNIAFNGPNALVAFFLKMKYQFKSYIKKCIFQNG